MHSNSHSPANCGIVGPSNGCSLVYTVRIGSELTRLRAASPPIPSAFAPSSARCRPCRAASSSSSCGATTVRASSRSLRRKPNGSVPTAFPSAFPPRRLQSEAIGEGEAHLINWGGLREIRTVLRSPRRRRIGASAPPSCARCGQASRRPSASASLRPSSWSASSARRPRCSASRSTQPATSLPLPTGPDGLFCARYVPCDEGASNPRVPTWRSATQRHAFSSACE